MTKFKGTKGSWKVKHSESKTAFNVVGTVLGGRYKIARCPYLSNDNLSKKWNEKEKTEAEANAKLIAAAPDLLEALEELHNLLEEKLPDWYLIKHHLKAEKAIKKATE